MSSDIGVGEWTDEICRSGFCFIEGCPIDPEATQRLLERISYIRHTHYGGFYDFTSDLALKDTAYTTVSLDAHTDTTYFTDPAGLQMFHLLSHTGGEGGASILVDGFKAARKLKREHPHAFSVLSTYSVPWHASGNKGVSITPSGGSFPVITEGTRDIVITGLWGNSFLRQIRWNNSDRGTMDRTRNPDKWYDAARKWQDILRSPELEYRFQLKPGKALSECFHLF